MNDHHQCCIRNVFSNKYLLSCILRSKVINVIEVIDDEYRVDNLIGMKTSYRHRYRVARCQRDWTSVEMICRHGYMGLLKQKLQECPTSLRYTNASIELLVGVPQLEMTIFKQIYDIKQHMFVSHILVANACRAGNLEIVKILLSQTHPTRLCRTDALKEAIKGDRVNVVKYLLDTDQGIDFGLASEYTNQSLLLQSSSIFHTIHQIHPEWIYNNNNHNYESFWFTGDLLIIDIIILKLNQIKDINCNNREITTKLKDKDYLKEYIIKYEQCIHQSTLTRIEMIKKLASVSFPPRQFNLHLIESKVDLIINRLKLDSKKFKDKLIMIEMILMVDKPLFFDSTIRFIIKELLELEDQQNNINDNNDKDRDGDEDGDILMKDKDKNESITNYCMELYDCSIPFTTIARCGTFKQVRMAVEYVNNSGNRELANSIAMLKALLRHDQHAKQVIDYLYAALPILIGQENCNYSDLKTLMTDIIPTSPHQLESIYMVFGDLSPLVITGFESTVEMLQFIIRVTRNSHVITTSLKSDSYIRSLLAHAFTLCDLPTIVQIHKFIETFLLVPNYMQALDGSVHRLLSEVVLSRRNDNILDYAIKEIKVNLSFVARSIGQRGDLALFEKYSQSLSPRSMVDVGKGAIEEGHLELYNRVLEFGTTINIIEILDASRHDLTIATLHYHHLLGGSIQGVIRAGNVQFLKWVLNENGLKLSTILGIVPFEHYLPHLAQSHHFEMILFILRTSPSSPQIKSYLRDLQPKVSHITKYLDSLID